MIFNNTEQKSMVKEYIRTGMETLIVICHLFGNQVVMTLQLNPSMLLSYQARNGQSSN